MHCILLFGFARHSDVAAYIQSGLLVKIFRLLTNLYTSMMALLNINVLS